jgi:hypothetical protein
VAHALFSFYDRGGKHLETDLRERKLAAVLEWENYLRATVKGFVEEALKSMDLAPAQITHVLFLFDLPSFNALRIRGLSLDEATATVAEMATAWLDQEFSKGGKS